MNIRKAELSYLPQIVEVYRCAKAYMNSHGNPTQWKDGYPLPELLEEDISSGQLYVVENEGAIHGAFVFALGEDPTYREVQGEQWQLDEPYGTIHRIASDGKVKGIFGAALTFCKSIRRYIRADTHEANLTMQNVMKKYGFQQRGIIICADGTPRIAFELLPNQ